MAEISPNYVGPMARWGMLLLDHPLATKKETLVPREESDIPPSHWRSQKGYEMVCKCVVDFGPGSTRRPITAYRFADVPSARSGHTNTGNDPEGWETWCTKTLGRVVKEAGYPDDVNDLKLVLLWRRRNAEIAGIAAGRSIAVNGAADDRVVDAAAKPDDDADAAPEVSAPPAAAPAPVTAPVDHAEAARRFAETAAAKKGATPELPGDGDADDADTIISPAAAANANELIMALAPDERTRFAEWCVGNNLTPNMTANPAKWTYAQYDLAVPMLLEWAEAAESPADTPTSPQTDVGSMTKRQLVEALTAIHQPTNGSDDALRIRLAAAQHAGRVPA
jgi:hypothetical protein